MPHMANLLWYQFESLVGKIVQVLSFDKYLNYRLARLPHDSLLQLLVIDLINQQKNYKICIRILFRIDREMERAKETVLTSSTAERGKYRKMWSPTRLATGARSASSRRGLAW